jgi:hypothetical protein
MIGLAALSLGSCKANNASGYQVQVLLMLSETLSPTATVDILEDGADLGSTIKDATVTLQLNGGTPTPVPYIASFGFLLSGNISGAQPKAGDTITANLTIGTKHISETVTVAGTPKIKALTGAQDASKAIVLTWDGASPPPDEIQVSIADDNTAGNDPMGYFQDLAGTATSFTIPPGTLKPGTKDIYVGVSAESTHQLTGPDFEAYSWFTISSRASTKLDTL